MGARTKTNSLVKRLVGIGCFSALAYIVTFVVRIPVQFLTFDAKDAVIVIASFIYGPQSGLIISLLAALIELITISGTGIYGFLMNFLSSCAFACTASLIYYSRRNLTSAIVGLYSSVAVTTAVMMGLNYFITPLYLGVDRTVVVGMLPTLLLPFNLAKSVLNAGIAMLLYKPIVVAMRRAHLIDRGAQKSVFAYIKKKDTDAESVSESSASLSTDPRVEPRKPSGFGLRGTLVTVALGLVTVAVAVIIFLILNG
jgi:riboflavin transporter FmnP